MRKTKNITLTIVASISASLMGCDNQSEEMKHCVDHDGVVVDEQFCNNPPPVHQGGGIVPVPIYRWYYGGGYRAPLNTGTRPSGGSYTPSVGRSYSPPSVGISRGGFGGTGRGVSVSS